MKKIFYLAAAVLCLGIAATSCKKDNKNEDKATIEDLGGGIYKVNGYRFVDLGLPSGLLWAENNVGAAASTDAGTIVAWGETETKSTFTADNYKYGKDEASYTKYAQKDGKKTLDAADDLATVALKAPCHTPLAADFKELFNKDNTTTTWVEKKVGDKSVYGIEVKSNKNNNSIFFPAFNTTLPPYGSYWAADIYEGTVVDYDLAASFSVAESSTWNGAGSQERYNGNAVRPVASNLK